MAIKFIYCEILVDVAALVLRYSKYKAEVSNPCCIYTDALIA